MGRKPINPRPKKARAKRINWNGGHSKYIMKLFKHFEKYNKNKLGRVAHGLRKYEKRKLTTKQKSRILLKPSVRPVTCRNEEFFKSFLSYPIPAFPSSSSFVSISTRQLPTKGSSKLSPLALYTVPSQLHIENVLQ
jgi:hypothetical protein